MYQIIKYSYAQEEWKNRYFVILLKTKEDCC